MPQEKKMQISDIKGTVELSNHVRMPYFGLGVFQVPDEEVRNIVQYALFTGYRHIDTAFLYANEKGVGHAVMESNVPREEIFVTSKVWNSDQGYSNTLRAFDKSMNLLGLDYIDLFLIHWPVKDR